jgi:hypothetical protein
MLKQMSPVGLISRPIGSGHKGRPLQATVL